MDKLTGIDIFVHAAKTGSFVGAARHLGLTPSAVSKAITRLEMRLNTQLFHRTTRALRLTEEGNLLLDNATNAVEQLEAAQDMLLNVKSEPVGKLRVSMPVVFGEKHIAPHLGEFVSLYPQIVVELHSTDTMSNLVDDGFDVLIRTGELEDSNMISKKLVDTRFITCAAPSYLQDMGIPSAPSELKHHNCCRFVFPETGRVFDWPFYVEHSRISMAISGHQLFTNASAMINSAISGAGIIHLQDYMLQPYVDEGKLIPILKEYSCDGGPISMVFHRHKHLAPKTRAFVDFIFKKLT